MTIEGRQQWLAHQRQKREGICQDVALLNKFYDGTALTDKEKKRVQRLKKNAQQRKCRRKDTALLTGRQLWTLMSVHFLTSFFDDW